MNRTLLFEFPRPRKEAECTELSFNAQVAQWAGPVSLQSFQRVRWIALVIALCGCRGSNQVQERVSVQPSAPPISSILVTTFRCDNAVTAEAVRNVFIEVLSGNRHIRVLREGQADVMIEGTITLASGGSSSAGIGGGSSFFAGKSQTVAGEYVSGVTALVLRDGDILTSASWGQIIAKGEELLPPEMVARRAADRLLGQLYRKGLKRD